MITKLPVALAAASMLCSGVAAAESLLSPPRAIGVSLDASILMGVGLSVGVPVGDRFNLRGVYHGFSYDDEFEDEDDSGAGNGTTYDAELDLSSFSVMADWYPFRGAFRVTAGLVSNGNEIGLNAQNSNGVIEIGDCNYRSDGNDPLMLQGAIDWKRTAPYLGIGWGGNMNGDKGLYGLFDIGVMFSGAPKASLAASGTAVVEAGQDLSCGAPGMTVNAATDPNVQREVQTAVDDANDEAEDFKLWPNIAFGIGWRF